MYALTETMKRLVCIPVKTGPRKKRRTRKRREQRQTAQREHRRKMQVGPLEPLTHDEWSFILNRTIETWSEQPPTLVNTKYQYIPSAYLFVNSGVYLTEGTLYRQSSVYESACTLRIWDWLFTLERMNEDFFEHVHKVRNIGASNPWQVVAI